MQKILKLLISAWDQMKSAALTNFISFCALAVAIFALHISRQQNRELQAEMRRQRHEIYINTIAPLIGVDGEARFFSLTDEQKKAALLYWYRVVVGEILGVREVDPELYKKEYELLVKNAATKPYLKDALCVLFEHSTLSGTREIITSILSDNGNQIECDERDQLVCTGKP